MKKMALSMAIFGGAFALYIYPWVQPAYKELPKVQQVEDVRALFPKTKESLEKRASEAIKEVVQGLEKIYTIPADKRTFDNTILAYDRTAGRFQITMAASHVLSLISPDDEVRAKAQEVCAQLQECAVINFSQNKKLYQALREYKERLDTDEAFRKKENLDEQELYCLKETVEDYERQGLQLPEETQKEIVQLKKELGKLELAYDMNIAKDTRSIEVTKAELAGLDKSFRKGLQKTKGKKYKLGIDYPTYFKVMEECCVGTTRERLYKEFEQRGYPANEEVLRKVIELRDKLAHLLGFKSYAELDITNQMAKNPEKVEEFLRSIVEPAAIKAEEEYKKFKGHLEGVTLTNEGKFYPWDLMFVKNNYKKKELAIDEAAVAQYFPMEHTLPALFAVYEKFFGISFKPLDAKGLWHESVKMVAVYKQGQFIGTLLLDLFPRPHKYSYAAQVGIVPTIKTKKGEVYPAVALVIANFPPATKALPALLKRDDVITFFHECGHAIHTLLGATELALASGTAVKNDFVEMPSQMLEEWMWDSEILKMVSKHYVTGESLPDELIAKIKKLKNFDSGTHTQGQLIYAFFSLECFKEGAQKDICGILKQLSQSLRKEVHFSDTNRGYCSFTHLMGYGAKYYGYLWSKVFALDLFDYIKQFGLLDGTIGAQYVLDILSKGGSLDPEVLLHIFLKRRPNSKAFFKDLGVMHDSKDRDSAAGL